MVDLAPWLNWVAVLSSPITAVIALAAAFVAWRALEQRRGADARAHWWDRTRWAIERAQDSRRQVRTVGLEVLALQASSRLATQDEIALLDAVWSPIMSDDVVGGRAASQAAVVEYSVQDDESGGEHVDER